MSTRGNIVIKQSKKGAILVNIYNHSSSYLSYLGKNLAEFLRNREIVNGISLSDTGKRISNGIEDLAAQLVTLLKEDPESAGGVYIHRPKSPLRDPEDYTYVIYPETTTEQGKDWKTGEPFNYEQETGVILITVYEWKKKIFNGTADEFAEWIKDK